MPARIAFEAARLAVIPDKYPQINVEDLSGITGVGCPAHATKEELVAQAVGIVMKTGRRARVLWSVSETICAELTDQFGGPSPRIRPCFVWSVSETIDGTPDRTICDTKLSMKSPHIVVYGRNTFVLFYPDALTKEELIAKGAEIVAEGYPRVCVVWSSTESIWPKL